MMLTTKRTSCGATRLALQRIWAPTDIVRGGLMVDTTPFTATITPRDFNRDDRAGAARRGGAPVPKPRSPARSITAAHLGARGGLRGPPPAAPAEHGAFRCAPPPLHGSPGRETGVASTMLL